MTEKERQSVDYTPAELELREIERQHAIDRARSSGCFDGRAWFDPDASKPMVAVDVLPPNLCGFWNLKETY